MIATADNALLFLVKAFLTLAMGVYVLRILLQLTHANFYNPISQAIYKLSQPLLRPLVRFMPRLRNFDTAAALVLLALSLVYCWLIRWLLGYEALVGLLQLLWIALLVIISLSLKLYILCLFALALLSWVGPGVSNPAANVLWSLCDPLLRPVRRILPLVAGLDLSPIPVLILLELISRLLPLPGAFDPGL